MKRAHQHYLIWLAIMLALTAVVGADLITARQAAYAAKIPASTPQANRPLTDLVVVADTTAGMQPELVALAAAFADSNITAAPAPSRYHLIGYRNIPNYVGSTEEAATYQNWLDNLNAAGGQDCLDALLQSLASASQNSPNSEALVVGGSAPRGDRARLISVINRLVKQGVNVNPVSTGWCPESELSEASLLTLARLSGGFPFVVNQADAYTATLAGFNLIDRQDTLIADNNEVNGVKIYNLSLDSTATTLGIDEEPCRPTWCLTCTLLVENSDTLSLPQPALDVQIIDPDGNVLLPGHPGLSILETEEGIHYEVDLDLAYTGCLTCTWQVRVSGNDGYVLNATADSGIHFDYLSKHLLRAQTPTLVRVRLELEPGTPALQDVNFGLLDSRGNLATTLNLFDDGQHGDGAAGDGIYGGGLLPQKGIWYISANGQLADGTAFRRLDPTPIRVKQVSLSGPEARDQLAGSTVTRQFTLANDDPQSAHTYELYLTSSQGWAVTGTVPAEITLPPGGSEIIEVPVVIPVGALVGQIEETTVTAVAIGDLLESDTLVFNTTVVDFLPLYLPFALKP